MKILNLIGGKGIGVLAVVLVLILAVFFLGREFNARGVKIDELKGEVTEYQLKLKTCLRQAQADSVRAQAVLRQAQDDSLVYVHQVGELQKVILDLRNDRNYWKDYAGKVESGKYCTEWYGFMNLKKRLVPCDSLK